MRALSAAAALLVLLAACAVPTAVAWGQGQQLFEAWPGGPANSDIVQMQTPSVFFSETLMAVALNDNSVNYAFACFVNPQGSHGGRCMNNTIVYTMQPLTRFTDIIQVSDTSAIFVASTYAESVVAYVDAFQGVIWRQDRMNSTAGVAYDAASGIAVVTFGHPQRGMQQFDFVEGYRVAERNVSKRVLWAFTLDHVDPTAVHTIQFSELFTLFGRVWFTYGQRLFALDLVDGPRAPQKMVTIDRPCGIVTASLHLDNCPNCTVAYQLDLLAPKYGEVEKSTTVLVSGNNAATKQFGRCGLRVSPSFNNVSIRFDQKDEFELQSNGPVQVTTHASSTLGTRSVTAYFFSGLVSTLGTSLQPSLIAYDAETGAQLWRAARDWDDLYSMPRELNLDQHGGFVACYQSFGKLIAVVIETNNQLWSVPFTGCSMTPAFDHDKRRLFCVNGSTGVTAVQPPTGFGSKYGTVVWSYTVATRDPAKFSGLQHFTSTNKSVHFVGVPMRTPSFLGLFEDRAPGPTAAPPPLPTTPAPGPDTTTPPPSSPGAPHAPGAPAPHGIQPGIVVLIVLVCLGVAGLGAAVGYRYWKLNAARKRRGAIDSALTYGNGGGDNTDASLQGAPHASVAQHSPASGYGSLYA